MSPAETQVRQALYAMQDAEYKKFHSGLIPTVDPARIIGVRTPMLRKFAKEYAFYNPHLIKKSYIDTCYENAHLGLSPKSIYASVHCNYTNCNIITSLKKIDNSIYLIGGSDLYLEEELLKEYLSYNSAIEYTLIHETKYYPHMEKPNEFLSTVFLFLS